eukprot:15437216-Alexandrium_andersonii.AAC.1
MAAGLELQGAPPTPARKAKGRGSRARKVTCSRAHCRAASPGVARGGEEGSETRAPRSQQVDRRAG